jgi:hypothetical protein
MKPEFKYYEHKGPYELCIVCGQCIVDGQWCWEVAGLKTHRLCRHAGKSKDWMPSEWKKVLRATKSIKEGELFEVLWAQQPAEMETLTDVLSGQSWQKEKQISTKMPDWCIEPVQGLMDSEKEMISLSEYLELIRSVQNYERIYGKSAYCKGRTEEECIAEAVSTQ